MPDGRGHSVISIMNTTDYIYRWMQFISIKLKYLGNAVSKWHVNKSIYDYLRIPLITIMVTDYYTLKCIPK